MKQRKDIGDTLFGVKDRDIIMAFLRAEEELALLKIRESVSKDASKALYKNISDIAQNSIRGSGYILIAEYIDKTVANNPIKHELYLTQKGIVEKKTIYKDIIMEEFRGSERVVAGSSAYSGLIKRYGHITLHMLIIAEGLRAKEKEDMLERTYVPKKR